MTITPEEKLMYEVMRAIYESGIPISFLLKSSLFSLARSRQYESSAVEYVA